jgi:hypothetical protein
LAEFDEGPLTSGLFVVGQSLRGPGPTLRIVSRNVTGKPGGGFERLVGAAAIAQADALNSEVSSGQVAAIPQRNPTKV